MAKKPTPKKPDTSAWVPQRDKIDFTLSIRELPWTPRQKEFIDLALNKDPKIIFIDGPAGSSKSILSVYVALRMFNEKKNGEMLYCRSLVESADKGMGYLPGTSTEKVAPWSMPLMDKLNELLPVGDVKRLVGEERIKTVPIGFMRGLSLYATTCIVDEAQNFSVAELITVLTRIGKFSKYLVAFDRQQSDLHGDKRCGISKVADAFDNQESRDNGIFIFKFGKEDIMRSEVLKFLIGKLEEAKLV